MQSTELVAAIGGGLFVLAETVVAIRLLLLWGRSRRAPELAVGGGLFLVAALGYPLTTAAGIGRVGAGALHLPLFACGMAAIVLGVSLLNIFTWKVFRPGSAWAAGLVAASFVAGAVVCGGVVHTLARAPAGADPIEFGARWWIALRLLFQVWYTWTAVEALLEFAMARRRLAIGLSDPVLVNRFLLWGAMGTILAGLNVVAMVLELRGLSPATDIAPALVLLANGVIAGTLMVLTFMPPESYVRFVERRSAVAPV